MICSVYHDEGAIMHGSPLFPTEQPSVHRQCVGQYNRNKIRETITDQQLRHWYVVLHGNTNRATSHCPQATIIIRAPIRYGGSPRISAL